MIINLNKNTKTVLTALTAILLFSFQTLQAKVTLPSVFSDNMVLQQKTRAAIWGKAAPGKTIEISTTWSNKHYTVNADAQGNWKTKVATPSYGGPYTITISDGEPFTLMNVLIGDVWICSGQSNMEMPLAGWGKISNYEEEIANAKYPNIRLLQVEHVTANHPLDDAKVANGGWKPCSPEYIGEFSSVAYFFAREVYKTTGIPIGLIHTSWGGTIAEAWTSAATLSKMPDFAKAVEQVQNGTEQTEKEKKSPNRTTVLYNAMIHPFLQYSIKGAIWYQGESNAGRAYQYRELFPAMIKDWRDKWQQGDFPFYFVQLANFMKRQEQPSESAWAELREAQLKTLALPNTGMALAIDIGLADNIHPKNKQEVGRRLALIALARDYGKKITYSGPIYQSKKIDGNQIKLKFKFTNGGLKAVSGQPLKGFAIAGADQKFHWAEAKITGNQIVVSSPEVKDPVAVRYAWANNPECNLVNGDGLPASPFRTDNWNGVTYNKK